jgi:hypothetical protein
MAMKLVLFSLIITAFATMHGWAQKNAPEEKSIVNKEFDENGNLIQYDSTYVWQWNSDSTFNFPFDGGFPGGFDKFFNDSVFAGFEMFNDDFFQQFNHSFPNFQMDNDSVFSFRFSQPFSGDFVFPELDELQKQLQEKFNHQNLIFPEFKSSEQREEWEKLMQKQQKEKEELLKKWEDRQ